MRDTIANVAQLTLNFREYGPHDEQYAVYAWITLVKWRDINTAALISMGQGVYIIDDGNRAVYAGQANSFRGRFDGRSGTLNEFNLTAAAGLPHYRVFAGSVIGVPANYANKIDWAEAWLVRFLYLFDQAQAARFLQNVLLTGPLAIPLGGINIRFDPNNVPAYLIGQANYQVFGANSAGYNYAAGAVL